MTSVESILTRQLDVRFIDARTLAAEARIALGIQGYPSNKEDIINLIVTEAAHLFHQESRDEQHSLRRLHWNLEAMKFPNRAMSVGESIDSASSDQSSSPSVVGVVNHLSSLSPSDVSEHRGGGSRRFFRRQQHILT